jgi:hypothetical protein
LLREQCALGIGQVFNHWMDWSVLVTSEHSASGNSEKAQSRKSDHVREFYTSFKKIFENLDLGLVFYRMMPKKREKLTKKKIPCMCTFKALS